MKIVSSQELDLQYRTARQNDSLPLIIFLHIHRGENVFNLLEECILLTFAQCASLE